MLLVTPVRTVMRTHFHSQSLLGGTDPFGEQIGLREIKGDLRIRGPSEITLVISMKPHGRRGGWSEAVVALDGCRKQTCGSTITARKR